MGLLGAIKSALGLAAKPSGGAGGGSAAAIGGADPSKYNLAKVYELAEAMPPPQKVQWATESAKTVQDKLPAADVEAISSAEQWLASPSPESAAKAAEAAKSAGHAGPGAWSAQAAEYSQQAGAVSEATTAAAAAGAPSAAGLASSSTGGAVLLAASTEAQGEAPKVEVPAFDGAPSSEIPELAMDAPEVPPAPTAEELQKTADALKPYIDRGEEILAEAPEFNPPGLEIPGAPEAPPIPAAPEV
ncbi:MAG: hypothetical protein AAFR38_07665 [Planctomycetota bacterium]